MSPDQQIDCIDQDAVGRQHKEPSTVLSDDALYVLESALRRAPRAERHDHERENEENRSYKDRQIGP